MKGLLFDHSIARRYDQWFLSPMGKYVEEVENQLILDLLRPQAGETLLDVGCGTGNHLLMFKQLGLDVCGVDPSEPMLEVAREKLGPGAELRVACAEDLPFDDNSFDMVTLISSLEFADPLLALSEAFRVARSRVFVAVLNRYSANGLQRRLESVFKPTIYRHARFYSIWQLQSMVQRILGACRMEWGSVIWLPLRFHAGDRVLGRWVPTRRNPFGAFLALRVEIHYSRRTILDPVRGVWGRATKPDPTCLPLHREGATPAVASQRAEGGGS